MTPDDPRHGTMNGYHNLGCRCDRCREACRLWWREKRAQRRATTVCPHCSGPGGEHADNECHACYEYRRRNGVDRPRDVYDPPAVVPCATCSVDLPAGQRRNGRCEACDRYLKRNGVERPARLWATSWLPEPPQPETVPAGTRVRLSETVCWEERRGASGEIVDPPARGYPQPADDEVLVLLDVDPLVHAEEHRRSQRRGWSCVVSRDDVEVVA